MKNQLKAVVLAVSLLVVGEASAVTWNLTGAVPSTGVTISGVANTGGIDTSASSANNGATQTIRDATWVGQTNMGTTASPVYYGGITNADACSSGSYCDLNEGVNPEHAIDNEQRYDMALLNFGASVVKLTSVGLSWISGDSDLTVLAFTGTGTFNVDTMLKGLTYDKLTANGWTVVANTNGTSSTYTQSFNTAGNIASSYWLIGAFNPLVASATGTNTGGFDYVKLSTVSGTVCAAGSTAGTAGCGSTNKAPEPGSLALMGVGLIGLLRLRKRR
uniref:Ice-binding protein C-terminal domain-containing protein n=1 Tax=Dechloromonas aromatica (strain RCB) TaxID=159087 RepID=Q47EP1_DECAR